MMMKNEYVTHLIRLHCDPSNSTPYLSGEDNAITYGICMNFEYYLTMYLFIRASRIQLKRLYSTRKVEDTKFRS